MENYENVKTYDVNSYFENLLAIITNSIEKIRNSRRKNANPKKKPNCWYDRELQKLKNEKERSYKIYLGYPNLETKTASDRKKYTYEKKLMEK